MTDRLFVIPDIHGRHDLLAALLEELFDKRGLDPTSEKLIFLGDMVDRGPDSYKVLSHVQLLTQMYPGHCLALFGNHERLMLDGINERDAERRGKDQAPPSMSDYQLWMWNGGGATERSFPGRMLPPEMKEWVESLPLYHEEQGFFFSHAPVPRERNRKYEMKGLPFNEEELTWTYHSDEVFLASADMLPEGLTGVCGHIHQLGKSVMMPRFYDRYIFADAGCGCSDKAPLVAIEVKTREVVYSWPSK